MSVRKKLIQLKNRKGGRRNIASAKHGNLLAWNPSKGRKMDAQTIVAFITQLRNEERLPAQISQICSRVRQKNPGCAASEEMIRAVYKTVGWNIDELCTLTKEEKVAAREKAKADPPKSREQRKIEENALAAQRKRIREKNKRRLVPIIVDSHTKSASDGIDELELQTAVVFLTSIRETDQASTTSKTVYQHMRDAFPTQYASRTLFQRAVSMAERPKKVISNAEGKKDSKFAKKPRNRSGDKPPNGDASSRKVIKDTDDMSVKGEVCEGSKANHRSPRQEEEKTRRQRKKAKKATNKSAGSMS